MASGPLSLFDRIPKELPNEFSEILAQGGDVKIERIVSRGHASAPDFWYDQDKDEFVFLVKGHARLAFDGQTQLTSLSPGDWLMIPAHSHHRVAWTDPACDTVWLVVFM